MFVASGGECLFLQNLDCICSNVCFAVVWQEMCHTYVVISENTLQEVLSNPHEFVSEAGTIVCFGG